jgi:hypothetical protein
MSESICINESARQFMVLDMILMKIEDADKIKRTMKMDNAEAAESFKEDSYSVIISCRTKEESLCQKE